uniref:Conserved oligomeric Golgi complex subunit 3 n=1 Tax=Psilocybe cubensis TaxID=181762 RepID=A0A8H7Y1U4_PSICU
MASSSFSSNMRRGTTPASLALSTSNLSDNNNTSGISINISNSGAASTSTSTANQGQRANVSLEEWERNTPLTELQLRSVNRLMKWNEERRERDVPLKFASEPEPGTPTHIAHRLLQKDGSTGSPISRSSTPNATLYRPEHALLHPSQPVQTAQQFYDWYALIDRSVAHSQEAHYRAHVATLSSHLEVCDLLLDRISEVDTEVDRMMEGWRGVEDGGRSLKDACERLLEERDRLVEIVEDIQGHLEYFQELEHATRMLNHPGESLIFQTDFLYMVERVDICIDFLKSHRHYREAEVYLLRFQQCMTRAMTLIKMNFVGSLRALSSEISKRLSEDPSPTAQHHLLYTRFRSISTRVAPLLGELERRAQAYPDELSALLAECHTAYLATRKALLVPRVMEEIRGLDPGRSELVELTREGCGYLKALCGDEWVLYREFFSTGETALYQYLETLCDLLYDDLRPRILHEPRLTVLCEVCTVLQALMVLDTTSVPASASSATSTTRDSSSSGDSSDSEDESSSQSTQRRRRRRSDELTLPPSPTPSHLSHTHASKPNTARISKRLHIATLLRMVLQDAQTRLFFKAQAVIQSEIRYFVPGKEDVDGWPGILVSTANRQQNPAELSEKQSTNQIFKYKDGRNNEETWYPTLRKTVWVLGQLRDFVKPAIFDDIAQEALTFCRLSLIHASELIAASTTATTPSPSSPGASNSNRKLDGALFLVRHILILKEVYMSLEEVRMREEGSHSSAVRTPATGMGMGSGMASLGSARALDFGVTETLTNMLSKTTSLLPEGLFASLGVSRGGGADGEGGMRGVKLDIDHALRKACEDTIEACAGPVCAILDTWTDKQNVTVASSARPLPTSIATSSSGSSSSTSGAGNASTGTAAAGTVTPDEDLGGMHTRFAESVQRDLRGNVARIRLYLSDVDVDPNADGRDQDRGEGVHRDGRTARILIDHVLERVGECYERWGEAVLAFAGENRTQKKVEVMSRPRVREMLRDVASMKV